MTQHSYFNLAGKGDILNNLVYINADKFTPVDKTLIPNGELKPVAGTPFDFRTPTAVGARINADDEQIKFGNDKSDALPKFCRECDVRFACNGECPKHRFISTPDGEAGLNYLCTGYKMFFRHIDPHMKTMSRLLQNNRAPAEIMELLAAPARG